MPFFGVPIRNGLPIGLGSVAGFGVQQFDPSQLFEGGTVAGAWYDPSDLSTMFTTDAGTTPVAMPGQGAGVAVGLILDKSGNGNHARSFGAGLSSTRPELRARVNLLTYSEEFDNGAWTKSNATVTANAVVAPNGTVTADKLVEGATTSRKYINHTGAASNQIFSVYAQKGERDYVAIGQSNGAGLWAVSLFNLSLGTYVASYEAGASAFPTNNTITSVGGGWYKISCTLNGGASLPLSVIMVGNGGDPIFEAYTGNGTSGIYIWGADLRPANIGANVPAYQRIADANTYDTSGFPLYLRFDGIDDSMYTPANLNLSGTDKVSVFAGVRKLSDAAAGLIIETSSNINSNSGAMFVAAPTSAAPDFGFVSKGTIIRPATASGYAAPITSVLTGIGDISGDSAILRVDGTQAASDTGDQGTGNYGTYPLFIGSRNNASVRLNAQLYSLIIAGSAVSAGNISATESWVAGRTGISIP